VTVSSRLTALLGASLLLAGCGSNGASTASVSIPRQLLLEARTIGVGERFHPPVTGPVRGPCRRALGPRIEVHVELFAANHVMLIPPGVGARRPLTMSAGRIVAARCYGALVTLDPTGVVYVRPGRTLTLSDLFRSWGQPLGQTRLAQFPADAGQHVAVFLDGQRRQGSPLDVPLTSHSEIVLEVGPHVPPHHSYTFPPIP
jgi:hypothetical protein